MVNTGNQAEPAAGGGRQRRRGAVHALARSALIRAMADVLDATHRKRAAGALG